MTFRYFTREEFDCQETGENEMEDEFIHALDALRHECGIPFRITSGYRSPRHSLEAAKPGGPGQHARGIAADIAVSNGTERFIIASNAFKLGFSGVGTASGFIHVDIRQTTPKHWKYKN